MCGIVGMVGHTEFKHEGMFKTMLKLDVIRGPHSTGMVSVTDKAVMRAFKDVGTPYNMKTQIEQFLSRYIGGRFLLGHNRYATTGKITKENAHPFIFKNVVGVHNGTLTHYSKNKLEKEKKFDVDSEALYYNIDKKGIAETYKDMQGAWTLVWYDNDHRNFYFIRNKNRPLVFWYNKEKTILFFASEDWMIKVAAEKSNIDLSDKPFEIEEDKLHWVNLDELNNAKENKPKDGEPVCRLWKEKKTFKSLPEPVVRYQGSHNWGQWTNSSSRTTHVSNHDDKVRRKNMIVSYAGFTPNNSGLTFEANFIPVFIDDEEARRTILEDTEYFSKDWDITKNFIKRTESKFTKSNMLDPDEIKKAMENRFTGAIFVTKPVSYYKRQLYGRESWVSYLGDLYGPLDPRDPTVVESIIDGSIFKDKNLPLFGEKGSLDVEDIPFVEDVETAINSIMEELFDVDTDDDSPLQEEIQFLNDITTREFLEKSGLIIDGEMRCSNCRDQIHQEDAEDSVFIRIGHLGPELSCPDCTQMYNMAM